jgi:hypothetical protein
MPPVDFPRTNTLFPNPNNANDVTPASFAQALLRSLRFPETTQNIKIIVGWEVAEGGHWNNSAKYNPLNTTQSEPGSSTFQSVGAGATSIRIYTSWAQGLQATVTTLQNGLYASILSMLRTGTASSAVAAQVIDSSQWGTHDLTASLIDNANVTGGAPISAAAGGTAGLGGTGTLPNDPSVTGFTVGDSTNPDEDFWTAINRLALERYWYSFSDGEVLYLADGPDLMKQTPAMEIDRVADAGNISSMELTFDNCLALDTPIPTPSGWTTIGELTVGDYVFGPDGRPTKVLHTSQVHYGHTCYRVYFDDKTSIVADDGHLWETIASKRDSKTTAKIAHQCFLGIRTTDEIRKTLHAGDRRRPMRNHHVRLTQALKLPKQNLPVDPYVLGYWLGDGYHHQPAICASLADADSLVAELVGAGYSVKDQRFSTGTGFNGNGSAYIGFSLYPEYRKAERGEDSITRRLHALGVWRNKHIPSLYLRSSHTQRLALLQGLMDSDGTVDSRCEITLHNERLALGVLELVRSLGYKPYWSSHEPRPPAKKRGFCVAFATRPEINCFRLRRKATRYIERHISKTHRGRPHRMIVDVKPVASVPVRCIEVDNDDHLYLAGEGMVPTHNTAWLYAVTHKKRRRAQRRTSLAKITSPVEAQIQYICKIDEVRAGDVVNLLNAGPGDGGWLVGNVRRSVFEVTSEINLVIALTPFTEGALNPAGVNSNNSVTTFTSSTGGLPNAQGYVNPVGSWVPNRIDAGVDGTLPGPYFAPGDSTILVANAHDAGWRGGGYIAGQLVHGPYSGKVWYVSEGITPVVAVGQSVKAGAPVGRPAQSPYGNSYGHGALGAIETGWAVPTQAALPLGFQGNSDDQGPIALAAGDSFNRFLGQVGAKQGFRSGRGVGATAGPLPGGYP